MIHYHGLPFSPSEAMVRAMRGRHCMVSFARPDQIEEAAEVCQSIALDNGAYSQWRRGIKVDFAAYELWCAHWLRHPGVDWALIPDDILGTEEDDNRLIEQWSLPREQSVPVWHLHESLEKLAHLVRMFPRVALGSSGEWSQPATPEWWVRMGAAMEVACDSDGFPRAKLHGLRMLNPVIFSHVPLASADSCNVARNLGMDSRWNGAYAPRSKLSRALIMLDRVELHPASRRWCGSNGVQENLELLG